MGYNYQFIVQDNEKVTFTSEEKSGSYNSIDSKYWFQDKFLNKTKSSCFEITLEKMEEDLIFLNHKDDLDTIKSNIQSLQSLEEIFKYVTKKYHDIPCDFFLNQIQELIQLVKENKGQKLIVVMS